MAAGPRPEAPDIESVRQRQADGRIEWREQHPVERRAISREGSLSRLVKHASRGCIGKDMEGRVVGIQVIIRNSESQRDAGMPHIGEILAIENRFPDVDRVRR